MFRFSGLVLVVAAGLVAVEFADAQTLTTLASFSGSNGAYPQGGLTLSGNILYGTTYSGGAYGDGAVFSVPVSGGSPTVLASLGSGNGEYTYGGLALSGSTLYGTTYNGGSNDYGTVFRVSVSGGSPTVLASFNGSNGVLPEAGLTLSADGSALCGTTLEGGAYGEGTVFSVPVNGGSPTVVASFNGSDGDYPVAGVTLSADGSTLYGTTETGGAYGYGAVFSVPASGGTPTLLASFNGTNGEDPYRAGVTLSGSTLYGTTSQGGAHNDGTVFSVPVSGGSPTVLASFNNTNGALPYAGLTLSADGTTLYGTTTAGGAYGDGTVFSVPVSGGSPTVVASFNGSDGDYPEAGLTLSANTLYGMTDEGGAYGSGTIFAITVPEPSVLALLGVGAACLLGYAWRRRKMGNRALVVVALASVLTMTASVSQAQSVFNMPNGEASLQFVTVGSPNNPPDTGGTVGAGSVPYTYQMGEYDVTVGQYCQFLNAVAATDTYGLYNSFLSNGYGDYTTGIVQCGSPGSYTYSVSYNASDWSSYVSYDSALYPSALAAANDAPVFAVTWGDAARFCNWLQNGQPTNLGETAGSTETGAYTLNGATSNSALMAVSRNTGASYFIPSENEWYKAAYYDPSNGTYWTYPTQSDTPPSNVLSATATDNANVWNSINDIFTDPLNYITPVGAFAASPGPYGTYDMGGDVNQWDEGAVGDVYRILRGGQWSQNYIAMVPEYNRTFPPADNAGGFRVAFIPEPGSIALLVCGAIAVLIWWERRR